MVEMKSVIWKTHERHTAIEMAHKGHSFLDIANKLKRSRSAVAGFLRRSGISIAKIVRPPPKPRLVKPEVIELVTIATKATVSFLDLKPRQCRWVESVDTTNPINTMYCGDETDHGSWCKHHRKLVYKGEHHASEDEDGDFAI
jgi:hypothetical protein